MIHSAAIYFTVRSPTSAVRTFPAEYLNGYEVGDPYCGLPDLLKEQLLSQQIEVVAGRRVLRFKVLDEQYGSMKVPVHAPIKHDVPMRRNLGIAVKGFACPVPNTRSWYNAANGAIKRILAKTPQINRKTLRRFRAFVRILLRRSFKPIPADVDLTFESWLDQCQNYNEARKNELREVWQQMGIPVTMKAHDRIIETHVKDEYYPKFKYPRLINATVDAIKIRYGPAAKQMEKIVYDNSGPIPVKFIKHVPFADRIAFMSELIEGPGLNYSSTDYTSFECSFSSELQAVAEQQLYSYMLRYHKDVAKMMRHMMDINYCHTRGGVSINIKGRRMSGEMMTSLGNGFTNLALMLFIFQECGASIHGAVVEGDDGLCSSASRTLYSQVADQLGFIVKQEMSSTIGGANFCGMRYDEFDQVFIVDPFERILNLGWTGSPTFLNARPAKLLQALRAKAFSLAYECPGCPILTELSDYLLRITEGSTPVFEGDYWENQIFEGVVDRTVLDSRVLEARKRRTGRTRQLFADAYGISESQQIECESYLNGLNTLQPLSGPIRELFMTCNRTEKADWMRFYECYLKECRIGDRW